MKRKTSALVLLLALAPNTTRPELDEVTKSILWVGGTALVVVAGATGLWNWYHAPYLCAGCDHPILEKESQTFKSRPCGHRYHTEHYPYDHLIICRGCEKEKRGAENVARTIDLISDSLEKQRLRDEVEKLKREGEARTTTRQQTTQDHYYAQKAAQDELRAQQYREQQEQTQRANEAREAQHQEEERIAREHRRRRDPEEATIRTAREAQQRELDRLDREKRKKDEQEARSKAEALRLAEQEIRNQRNREDQERQERVREAQRQELARIEQAEAQRRAAQVAQTRETERKRKEQQEKADALFAAQEQALEDAKARGRTQPQPTHSVPVETVAQEQERIKRSEFMMKECSICLVPLAQKGDRLIDLKKPENRCHVTALPCGHVYHTTCIKEAAKHDARCPECRNPFDVRDL